MNKYLISVSGVAMALVLSSTALGAVTTFTSGTPISSSAMNANFEALTGNLTGSACTKNAGDEAGGMVRIGPICVDKFKARADFTGCAADGTTGCTVAAVSISTGTAASGMSWAQAARACTNAGKRLLTPGEWMAAFVKDGATLGMTSGMDFVDAIGISADESAPGAGDGTPFQAGYMGPRAAAAGRVQFFANIGYDVTGSGTFLGFRCGR